MWRTKNSVFGFIDKNNASEIVDAVGILPDKSLIKAKLKITIDYVRIMKYPGGGTHDILLNVYGQTQSGNEVIPLSYSLAFPARNGDAPLIAGYSLFVGLCVGSEGINFQGQTVNVKNQADKTFFNILADNVFKNGMQLLNSAATSFQPLIKLTEGIVQDLVHKNEGIGVQSFLLGLDFSDISTHSKLREGSFVIIQIPPDHPKLDWNEWQYLRGQIVKKNDPTAIIPYNCLIFGVSKITE